MNKTDILPETNKAIDQLTSTLLYEGYYLFPYRSTALKNQKPIPFGIVYPSEYNRHNENASSVMQVECLYRGDKNSSFNVTLRFLHLYKSGEYWKAVERNVVQPDIKLNNSEEIIIPVSFENDIADDSDEINSLRRISGKLIISSTSVKAINNIFRINVRVENNTPLTDANNFSRDEIMLHSFLSTNFILNTENGIFISSQSPDQELSSELSQLKNINSYPILIDHSDRTILSSSIALYDYPEINPTSPGDFFDATEIEEALVLHVGVLTDEEKSDIENGDQKLRDMMDRVKNITPEELLNLHGGLKNK